MDPQTVIEGHRAALAPLLARMLRLLDEGAEAVEALRNHAPPGSAHVFSIAALRVQQLQDQTVARLGGRTGEPHEFEGLG